MIQKQINMTNPKKKKKKSLGKRGIKPTDYMKYDTCLGHDNATTANGVLFGGKQSVTYMALTLPYLTPQQNLEQENN